MTAMETAHGAGKDVSENRITSEAMLSQDFRELGIQVHRPELEAVTRVDADPTLGAYMVHEIDSGEFSIRLSPEQARELADELTDAAECCEDA